MSDNREVAKRLLIEAGNTILKDRVNQHGSAENSFQMIGDLWTAYLAHVAATRTNARITPADVAQMMVMLKIARATYGDPTNRDNFVDELGYAALAGMLQLPDMPDGGQPDTKQMEKTLDDLDLEKIDA